MNKRKACAASAAVLGGILASQAMAGLLVQKTVNDPTLMPGAAVEFTVTVSNQGGAVEEAVEILDTLQPGLEIVAGTAPFVSQGDFADATGLWQVGTLDPGAGATLVIPAQVTANSLPPCLYNEARVNRIGGIRDPITERAFATLHRPGVERCVDLAVAQVVLSTPVCGPTGSISLSVQVSNRGPDTARDVLVELVTPPERVPGLRLRSPVCASQSPTSCVLSEIRPGAIEFLDLTSDGFENGGERVITIGIGASSPDPEVGSGVEITERQWTLPKWEKCSSIDLGSGATGVACFIATAAYGSELDPHVQTLRSFRDRFLMTNAPGRALVAAYYRWSPPIADYIAPRPWLRAVVRALLWPLVLIAEGNLIFLSVMFFLVLLGLRRRWMRQWMNDWVLAQRNSHSNKTHSKKGE